MSTPPPPPRSPRPTLPTADDAGRPTAPSGRDPATVAREVWQAVHDPRYRWWQRAALAFSLLLVLVAVSRIPGMDWGQRLRHGWYHAWVAGWFLLVSYRVRTVGVREVVRFWLWGFFPVALVAYALSEPLEGLLSGNVQTALWVPLVEELVKVAPLLLVSLFLRPRHRHATLSDFWLLGFALGSGFGFHEDALYVRLASSGFADGLEGTLFPTFLRGSQYVVTHGGWTALAGVGVGIALLHRRRVWALPVGATLVAVAVLDHAAVNWRGGGSELVRSLAADGQLAASLLLLTAMGAVAHDVAVLRWANERDAMFPQPLARDDVQVLLAGTPAERLGRLAWRQRYRRFRNAVFVDLYRVRSRGATAGDRSEVQGHLRRFTQLAERGRV